MSTTFAEKKFSGGQSLQIAQGDLTLEAVDAIVNAANEDLQHGGGVAWAIVRRGGDSIQIESDEWIRAKGRVSHAHPAWTLGGRLPAKYIIHAVGPIWGAGDEDAKLAQAVSGALRLADELRCASLALPAISTGIFGFPKARAAKIILWTIEEYFSKPEAGLKVAKIVLFDQPTVDVFLGAWA